ncbi:MAG TPA: sulfatase, partial [Pirellulales bacterium]
YDLQSDPDEIHNLAGEPEHQATLGRLREAQQDFARQTIDLGFLPEGERFTRASGESPFDMARRGDAVYPFDRVFATAELASLLDPQAVPELKTALSDSDSAVRYWGAMGLLMRGEPGFQAGAAELKRALSDPSSYVQIVVAQALVSFGSADEAAAGLERLIALADWDAHDEFVVLAALNAIDALGDKASPLREQIARLPTKGKVPDPRYNPDVPKLLRHLKASLN